MQVFRQFRLHMSTQNTVTANLLTLNSFETEFLFIGLQQQLTKIHNCSLNITDSARNLGFIIDFSDQMSSL